MSYKKKIAMIGAGQIGGSLAMLCGIRKLGDVVLYDIAEGMPEGKSLDMLHGGPSLDCDINVLGTNNIADIEGADVCIVTSGIPRKPGMSRDDLVNTNAGIIKSVAEGIKQYAPSAFVIVITNPLDAMAYVMKQVTGFAPEKVVGMAGVLDSNRYKTFLAQEIGVSATSLSAMVLGGHGDTMVPIRSHTVVNGIPVEKFLDDDTLTSIENRVRKAGGEIVSKLKTGSAFQSPAASAIEMAESYLFDQRKVLPAAAFCQGEYGYEGIYLGVPVVIGKGGIEKIIEIDLTDSEKEGLQNSADAVKGLIASLPK